MFLPPLDGRKLNLAIDDDFMIYSRKDILVVNITGDLDAFSVQQVNNQLTQVIEDGYRKIVLNLSRVQYINCTSIGVLLGRRRKLKQDHGELAFAELSDRVNRILALVGGEKLFPIFNTENEAIDTLAQAE
jgi:anti-anti-sigma factor